MSLSSTTPRGVSAFLLAVVTTLPLPTWARGDADTLRIVPHSNLAILDPIWTTAYMSRNHGYMIYDTLFGTDEKAQVKPQMVDSWTVSPDQRLWIFKLRAGLEFHDGKPVTGADVVASPARWGKRDSMGAALMGFVERMDSPAQDGFRIFLREPCGFVLDALGKPSSNVPFIMPARVAETDPFKQIEDHTGSGPYVFRNDEFKPGNKVVYVKNSRYVARKEAPSGSTGAKNVYVERVEWNLALRDAQAQLNALQKGEVDIIEALGFDQFEAAKKIDTIQLPRYSTVNFQFFARFNHLHKPFDNARVRQAATAALAQEPFLRAQVGVKELYKPCPSMFTCGTPYASAFGSAFGNEGQSKSGMKKAQELLKASGYDGTPVVLMKPTDLASIQKLPDVAAQLLRQAGFKVELLALDWQSLVARRARKDAPDKGGWNMFLTSFQGYDVWNPISNAPLDARGEQAGWFGWPKDERLIELRGQFMREVDDTKKKTLAEAIQARAFEVGTHVPLGEFLPPLAAGKNISGFFVSNVNLYWNLKKH